jgi:PIN domain nuclease of toxin-antitoxin system
MRRRRRSVSLISSVSIDTDCLAAAARVKERTRRFGANGQNRAVSRRTIHSAPVVAADKLLIGGSALRCCRWPTILAFKELICEAF